MSNILLRALRLATFGLAAAAFPAAAQTGSITGRVTDQSNGQSLVGARVQVIGTSLTGQTNADGRFRFTNVPTGQATVRVVALGYAALNKVATVAGGQETAVDFALILTPFSLDEFVVTATGEQQRREVAHAISTVEVSNLAQTAPAQNFGDILAARAPSVTVLPSNITGGGTRVRIRGNSSISLSNEPIYVVDGIRIWGAENSSSIGIGGTNPGRINDLNPEDIEAIDIIRGPSASTLYGTDAANGVIVIKTKRGKAGRPVWNAYTEQGMVTGGSRWPTAYRGWTAGSTVSNTTQCFLFQVAAGSCTQDSVSAFNLFEDPDASPNGRGHRQQYGLQVGGGSDVVTYYLSGEWEDETGYLKMPEFARNQLLSTKNLTELRDDQERPNALTRTNLRANLTAHLSQKLDVQISSGFVSSSQRLPQTDNNTTGLLSNGFGGPGFKTNMVSHGTGLPARQNYGFRLFTPDEFFSESVTQDINRTMLSGTANLRPLTWLSVRGVSGVDFTSREDSDICRRDDCVPGTFGIPFLAGFRENNRTTNWVYTGDFSGTASYSLTGNLRARTTVGTQFSKERFDRNGGFTWDLTPGATTLTAGANPEASEATTESSIWGLFVEHMFAWRDRVFVTGALRTDRNNAFGQNFNRVYYPKASVSWVLSDEEFFGSPGWLNNLRLRAAYGASGRQPGANDALSFFTPSTSAVDGADTPSLIFSAQGNPDLKPERTSELELGFDASFANSRLNLEFTWYNKNSLDALLFRQLPPSLGTAPGRWENIGKVKNTGVEAVLNAVVIDKPSIGWDMTIGGNYGSNEVRDMGGVADIVGATTITAVGFPIQGWYLPEITFEDANGDGLIAQSEITAGPRKFIGYSQPRGEVALFTGLELFNRRLRLQANLDSKFGSYQLNGNDRIRCESRRNCREAVDPTAPLWMQARATAIRTNSTYQTGFVEKIDFIRFREVSASYTVPESWPRLVGAQRATVTLGARNLGLITDYSGMDPETGYFSGTTGLQSDFQSGPPPRFFTFRLNVTF
ncbi:MAG TPA: SusC/RagA family TonB-linked outer membrane protein [Gemmatimonadales bacterium]